MQYRYPLERTAAKPHFYISVQYYGSKAYKTKPDADKKLPLGNIKPGLCCSYTI